MSEAISFQQLLNFHQSSDPDEREQAARELRNYLPASEPLQALDRLLADQDWRVRRAAVDSFLSSPDAKSIEIVIAALYDEENAGKRNAAIDILSRLGKEIIPQLGPHLYSENNDVRMFLINILGDLRDRTYKKEIRKAIEEKDENLISAALIAIGKIGDNDALRIILNFLKNADDWLRFQAIEAAGELQDPEAIPALIKIAGTPLFRRVALHALARIPHPDSYRALVRAVLAQDAFSFDALEALVNSSEVTRPAAIAEEERQELKQVWRALCQPNEIEKFTAALQIADLETQKRILKVLAWSETEDAAEVISQYLDNPDLSQAAAESLIDCGIPATRALAAQLRNSSEHIPLILDLLHELSAEIHIGLLQDFLRSDSEHIRDKSYQLLIPFADSDKDRWLVEGLFDPYEPVREACLKAALKQSKEDENLQANILEVALQKLHSSSWWERASALESVVHVKQQDAFPLLLQASKDEEPEVRQKAVALMSNFPQPDFERPLIAALTDEDARVRELAARALSQYPPAEVVEPLLSCVNDEVLWVRIATYEALSKMNEERVAKRLLQQIERDQVPIARAVLLRCLYRQLPTSTTRLALMYSQSADAELRKSACQVFAGSDDPESLFRLKTILQHDLDWSVRCEAIRALSKIKPPDIAEILINELPKSTDPIVQKEILEALSLIKIDSVPDSVYELLLDRKVCDSAYSLLLNNKDRLAADIRTAANNQRPAIRRVLNAIST